MGHQKSYDIVAPFDLFCLFRSKIPGIFDPNLEFRVPTSSAYDCGVRITSSPKYKEKLCIRKRKICTSLFENRYICPVLRRSLRRSVLPGSKERNLKSFMMRRIIQQGYVGDGNIGTHLPERRRRPGGLQPVTVIRKISRNPCVVDKIPLGNDKNRKI